MSNLKHIVVILNKSRDPIWCRAYDDKFTAYLEFGTQCILRGIKSSTLSSEEGAEDTEPTKIMTPKANELIVRGLATEEELANSVLGKLITTSSDFIDETTSVLAGAVGLLH